MSCSSGRRHEPRLNRDLQLQVFSFCLRSSVRKTKEQTAASLCLMSGQAEQLYWIFLLIKDRGGHSEKRRLLLLLRSRSSPRNEDCLGGVIRPQQTHTWSWSLGLITITQLSTRGGSRFSLCLNKQHRCQPEPVGLQGHPKPSCQCELCTPEWLYHPSGSSNSESQPIH